MADHFALADSLRKAGTDAHVMANTNRCTSYPQHVMVNQGYSMQHDADIYRCACGESAMGYTDELRARRAG